MSDDVALYVGGNIHRGWPEVSITLTAERVAGSFSLTLAGGWVEAARIVKRTVHPGDACVVRIGGEVAITGHVDRKAPSYDKGSHIITVEGRDITGDLVDCSSDHREFIDQPISRIASDLIEPFGIGLAVVGDTGKPFERFATNVGDGVIEAIERACRMRGLIAYSDGLGTLVLSRGLGGGAPTERFERGKNVLKACANHDFSNRFSTIVVKTSREGSDHLSAEDIAQVSGTATDSAIRRHRPLVLLSEMQADGLSAAERAAHENRVRIARSQKITVHAQGWLNPQGALRRPGQMVQFSDEWVGASGTYVISEVTLAKGIDGGTTSQVTLMPPGAFDRLAEPDKKAW